MRFLFLVLGVVAALNCFGQGRLHGTSVYYTVPVKSWHYGSTLNHKYSRQGHILLTVGIDTTTGDTTSIEKSLCSALPNDIQQLIVATKQAFSNGLQGDDSTITHTDIYGNQTLYEQFGWNYITTQYELSDFAGISRDFTYGIQGKVGGGCDSVLLGHTQYAYIASASPVYQPRALYTFQYNVPNSNLRTNMTIQLIDTAGNWVNYRKEDYSFQGNTLTTTESRWINGAWQFDKRNAQEILSSIVTVSTLEQFLCERMTATEPYEFTFRELALQVKEEYDAATMQWGEKQLWTHTHAPDSSSYEIIIDHWNDSTQQYERSDKGEWYYNSYDEKVLEAFSFWIDSLSTWQLDYADLFELTYNGTGDKVREISRGVNSRGDTSNRYRIDYRDYRTYPLPPCDTANLAFSIKNITPNIADSNCIAVGQTVLLNNQSSPQTGWDYSWDMIPSGFPPEITFSDTASRFPITLYATQVGNIGCDDSLTQLINVQSEGSCITIGINGLETSGASIYPNPVQSTLSLEFTNGITQASYTLTDLMGRTIKAGEITGTDVSLNLDGLKAGTYILNLTDGGNTVATQRVVKW